DALGFEHAADVLPGSIGGPKSWLRCSTTKGMAVAGILCCACLVVFRSSIALARPAPWESRSLEQAVQHVYIVRHGDKYSSYPACPVQGGGPCYDATLMGDNPPLTDCGIRQAEFTAGWMKDQSKLVGGIQNIVVSPFTRTLQSALPLAKALNQTLKVEYLVSEANQPEGPFREANINAPGATTSQLHEIHDLWDRTYGGPPIWTPENNTLYVERVQHAAKILRKNFPPSSGNLVIYTHATTSFSMAYGLCYGESGDDAQLEKFVNGQDAIAPAGVIHLVFDAAGKCMEGVGQTQNVAEKVDCGLTLPCKCDFDKYPSWYWASPRGMGPGLCT
ncbi:unnamed protein product, partial [Polarella glacialis]